MITLLATFGNLFGPDMLVIFLIVLLLFGAKKLPELARGLGQSLNEFKKAREDFEHELRQGQQDPQAREAGNRQPYTGVAAVPSAQALPYNAPVATTTAAAAATESPEALRQKVEQLQQQLRELEAQKSEVPQAPV
jgi:sec-independent protein translocase protein TatA